MMLCCISIFGVFINGWMFTDGYIAAIRNLGLARFRFVLYTLEEMNNGNVNVVILLDLKNAFDVVDHDIMAKKLEIYGFNKKSFSSF
jgi:hypothetical protein